MRLHTKATVQVNNEDRGAILTVDLGAIAKNYETLRSKVGESECAAVVKANAYGLGVEQIAPVLWQAGCRVFFVATFEEGAQLRHLIPEAAEIAVLNGLVPNAIQDYNKANLVPVLNDLAEIENLSAIAKRTERNQTAMIHCDTGMNRLGLDAKSVNIISENPKKLAGIDICGVMSHLACAEEQHHPYNAMQQNRFKNALSLLPASRASLANSSGVFLGSHYHFDMVRPGIALYGVNPTPGQLNPMREAVSIKARALQIRNIDSSQTVGYGATHRFSSPRIIATISIGYADGLPHSLSNNGHVAIKDKSVPIIGRVSMDTCSIDISSLPSDSFKVGDTVTIVGQTRPLESLAQEANTIPYEILTRLGPRLGHIYLPRQ
tara:strand:+ start:1143 stop:2276 length:1134 start_codon:yes stop_codon:yes gene_type:complete